MLRSKSVQVKKISGSQAGSQGDSVARDRPVVIGTMGDWLVAERAQDVDPAAIYWRRPTDEGRLAFEGVIPLRSSDRHHFIVRCTELMRVDRHALERQGCWKHPGFNLVLWSADAVSDALIAGDSR